MYAAGSGTEGPGPAAGVVLVGWAWYLRPRIPGRALLTANCPSCGALVTFAHAQSVASVCKMCRNSVVREGMDLKAIGKVSAFDRDLSPVRIGASGNFGGRRFSVAGVLRKARERVRWNEWFLVFEDGGTGWLGEGNGEFQVYTAPASAGGLPDPRALRPGEAFDAAGTRWVVAESAVAEIAAAAGELPYPVVQGEECPYADLRAAEGGFAGTLDASDGPPVLYAGRIVPLASLQMEGLRHFAGWSDPAFTAFAGPDIEGVKSLSCPGCGAPLSLRAPGQSVRVVCVYCGSELGVGRGDDESKLDLLARHERQVWQPAIPLGTRGTVAGVPWEVIGVMERSVRDEGVDYPWTEYLLHNPYRGFRWLVEDGGGHYSGVVLLSDAPREGRRGVSGSVTWRGQRFRHFQGAEARVRKVLGEFTWEVRAGDRARTDDLVAPPRMLSREETKDEITWSLGEYLPIDAVRQGFSLPALRAPSGIAPHQPNPWAEPSASRRARRGTLVLLAATLVLLIGGSLSSAREALVDRAFETSAEAEQVFVTPPFTVPRGLRRSLDVEVTLDRGGAYTGLAAVLVPTSGARGYVPAVGGGAGRVRVRGTVPWAAPGEYLARVELAGDPKSPAAEGARVHLRIVRDTPYRTPAVLLLFFGLLAPVARWILYSSFEARRWAESDHAG